MPSNAQGKTQGSKNQNKPSAPKYASTQSHSTQAPSKSASDNLVKSTNAANGQKPKTSSATVPADLPPSTVSPNNIDEGNSGVGVNKKKQKRRQKEAARKAAEQQSVASPQLPQHFANVPDSRYQEIVKGMAAAQTQVQPNGHYYGTSDYDDPDQYEPNDEGLMYQQYQDPYDSRSNGHNVHDYVPQEALSGKAKKKKKAKANTMLQDAYSMDNPSLSAPKTYQPPPPPPPPPSGQYNPSDVHHPMQNNSKDRIWNTSTAEERERIKDFWLSLGEEDRRSLVKVEKEAVLKKMKEQQKHSCSCTVCGRKRTAIEEELEVLYDAYYEELEVYANPNQGNHVDGNQALLNAHSISRMPPNPHTQMPNGRTSRGRIQELGDDDAALEEEDYSDDDDDEDISEDEYEDQAIQTVPSGGTDFFNFGRSLTVQGGILTVADDLLKNDGKKFIEMMEQLAERRMQREEDQYARAGLSHQPHNHNQPTDDEPYDDEEDEEEYEDDEEDYDEEDEMEQMTEHERMKEGRRMFQIFAARMFEQRVLTAYREKVALERQKKLLEELDDESRVDAQREAKKAKEAQKKKDKKRQQKEAKDAEKAKREAEKAAEEAAAKALEEKKAEEVRQKKEEQRKKREAEKKAQEEDKQRKEAEKQKRLQEAKDQQAELERKQRDQKEREKKKREEAKKKEREEKEAKEREVREKKERDLAEKRERETKIKAENEAKERLKQEAQITRKRQSPANVPSTPMPASLHPPATTSSHTSPRLQIATPVVPKAPTPVRPRQPSFQGSQNMSPKTSQPVPSSNTTSPSAASGLQNPIQGKSTTQTIQQQPRHPSQASQYSPASASPGQPLHPPGLPNLQKTSGNPFPSTFGPPLSPTTQQHPQYPLHQSNHAPVGSSPYRNFMAPNGIPFPPGISAPGQTVPSRASMTGVQLPHVSTGLTNTNTNDMSRYGMSRDNIPSQTHSRNTSASFDRSGFDTPITPAQTQPIARPAPIKRPSSVAPYQQGDDHATKPDVDDLSNHLGSSALLDDNDPLLNSDIEDPRRGSMAPPASRTLGQGFSAHAGYSNHVGATRIDNFSRGMQNGPGGTWSAQQSPFGGPPMSGPPQWSNAPAFGRTNVGSGFGSIGGASRMSASRAVTIRLLTRTACEKLTARSLISQAHGWHRAEDVLLEVQTMKPGHEGPIHMKEMLDMCDTEGNGQNGGGSFTTRREDLMGTFIRFDAGRNASMSGRVVGDIGSPTVGNPAIPAIGGQRSFQQPGGF
ncbi:Stress response protein nst1 [Lecanora helva]